MEKYLLLSDGLSPHTLKWARGLSEHFDLYLISLTSFKQEILNIIDPTHLLALNLSLNVNGGNAQVLTSINKIAKFIQTCGADYIHAQYITSYGFLAALVKRLYHINAKLILSAWGTDILVTPRRNIFYREITKYALNTANVLTSDSEYMSDHIQYLCGKRPITLPLGVESLLQINNNDKDDNLFFSNRALYKNYNIDKIIILFSKIVKQNPDCSLIIANDGEEKESLVKLSTELEVANKIKFVGYLSPDEQLQLYKKSRYYFSIPSSDATSVSLLEAMSCGCIPIVTNIPANREWIINKVNGFYLEDDIELAAIAKDKEQIFNINRKIIETKALWENNLSNYIDYITD